MVGTITTGSHPKALWEGMHVFWGREYDQHPDEWKALFSEESSMKNYEEDTEVTGFGLAPVKPEGSGISYDSESQGPTTRYTHVVYGLGYQVTREEQDDNLYEVVSKRRIRALAFSMKTTKNIVGANVFNNGFNSSFVGGDGVEMLSTAHPTVDGTQSNELATSADLSEVTLEDLLIQVAKAKNSRGLQLALTPKCLLVAPDNVYEATRITKSEFRFDTANNDINAHKALNKLPEGVKVNHYLTDPDAWFVLTNCPNSLQHFNRRAIEFTKDNEFDTENAKAKSTERYAFGHTDWRGVYGSPGN